eukprot:g5987.t1
MEGDENEGWLSAFEEGLFEEEEDGEQKEERCRAARAFAAQRREKGWRLTHEELYDRAGQGRLETSAGPVHFERGQGQQGRAWDCSLVLAKYLEKHPEEVRTRGVLELGCGVGLPGVAAAVLGAEEVTLTDMAEGLPTIERTIELNPDVADRLKGRVLLWGDEAAAAQLLARNRRPMSVVLCSDLLYGDGPPPPLPPPPAEKGTGEKEEEEDEEEEEEEEGRGGVVVSAAEALATTLSSVVRTSECTILSCHERRWAGDKGAYFFETMARRGFCAEAIDPGDIDERYRGDSGISFSRIRLRDPS